jgi:hypothetical protein
MILEFHGIKGMVCGRRNDLSSLKAGSFQPELSKTALRLHHERHILVVRALGDSDAHPCDMGQRCWLAVMHHSFLLESQLLGPFRVSIKHPLHASVGRHTIQLGSPGAPHAIWNIRLHSA